MIRAIRRALKPALLWLNAALYKVSEEQIVYLRSFQANLYELELVGGKDTSYFARFRMDLSAQEHRERLRQWKLRQQRDRINQW
jgi:hypothetical protein